MSDPNKPAPSVTRQEIPRDEIVEAAKNHDTVKLRIKRRDSKGRLVFVTSGVMMQTLELLHIDEWIFERAGGGDYRIETEAFDDPTGEPLKPFLMFLEGPPKRFGQPGASPMTDARYRDEEDSSAGSAVSRMALSSNRQALDAAANERRQREEEKRQAEARERVLAQQIETLREQNRTTEARARDDAHRAEINGLRELISQRQAQPAPPRVDMSSVITTLVGFATALVPVAVAMVQAGATRKSSELESQRLLMQGQTDMFKAMVLQKPQESEIMKLLPTILPLMKGFLSERDPGRQAEMWGVLGDQMLTQAQLAGDMMRQFAESQPDQPAWMGVATELFGGIERYAKMIYETQIGKPASGARDQSTEVVPGAPQGAVAASSDGVAPPPRPASAPSADMTHEQKVNHVISQLPVHFQNQEWGEIVWFIMMGDTANIGGIGATIVDLLAKMQEAGAVPPDLYPIYEDPTRIGPLFIDLVPMKSQEYRDKVYKATLAAMRTPAPGANGSGGPSGRVPAPEENPAPARVM